jgi:uncharacterized protein YndB with AHSA1/START domain
MNPSTEASADLAAREIVTTRVFDFPRARVWRAWAEPEILARWWGPNGFTNTFHVFDLRPGGEWRFVMHGPDGTDYKNQSIFLEIARPERLSFDHVSGHLFQATTTLEALGDNRTRVTYRMLHPTAEACEKIRAFAGGANEQLFDRLGDALARMT